MKYKTLYVLVLIAFVAVVAIGYIAFRKDDTENQIQVCQEVMNLNRERCLYLIENDTFVVVKEPTSQKDN